MEGDQGITPADRKRFFVLTPGRSGSELLGLILRESGAKFYVGAQESIYADTRLYEHPELNRISYLLEQAHRLQSEYRYSLLYSLFYHKIITYKRFAARRKLRKFLDHVIFSKNTNHLHHGIRLAAHLGFWPVVILNYRNYQTWIGSLYPGQRYETVPSLTDGYNATMRNSLALLSLFGGCAVSYEEIMTANDTEWAHVLGQVTGLDAKAILSSRDRLLKAPGKGTALPVHDAQAERLEASAREHQGTVVVPSRVALQYWGPNPTKGPLPKKRFLKR